MARSDLLLALVKAGSSGDKQAVRATAEAIIAEERSKQHNVLADRLARVIHANGNGNGAVLQISPDPSRSRDFISEITPRRRLEDLALTESCRLGIDQLIEEQRRADILRSHSLEPRHRLLLVGPPGNGKTSLAEAVAEALGVSFFVVRYETIIGSYLGETATRLKRVFDYARTTPCVLFFDEFDAIGKERGDIHETGEIKRVVTSLLMQVDDLPSYTVIIAATNHSELLDRAAWRRFQLRLELPMPDEPALALYFEAFAKQVGRPLGYSPAVISKKLGRISYADAEQFCLNIRRRYVLAMGEKAMKEIVTDQLAAWDRRAGGVTNP
jgi:SpoVK/Ycf46/Vps4 family AAA+-type ATPase